MENFLPKDNRERLISNDDGTVRQVLALCQGRDILFTIKDGRLRRQITTDMPFFEIPKSKLEPLYRQIAAIVSDREKSAKLAREVKRPEWISGLKKCGISISSDGRIIIPRWVTNKAGYRRPIQQTVKDINAAIRMQDHIMEKYSDKAALVNSSDVPEAVLELLKKFKIIQPYIALRRQLLIYARGQMEEAIKEALARLNVIAAATVKGGGKHQALTEKIARLSFFLKNNWAYPYLVEIERVVQALNQAKRAMNKSKLPTVQLLLLRAKQRLGRLAGNSSQSQSDLVKLGEVDPIKTLSQVNRLGKADEVMAMAKKLLPGSHNFYLVDLLAISGLVLADKKLIEPAEQTGFNFGG